MLFAIVMDWSYLKKVDGFSFSLKTTGDFHDQERRHLFTEEFKQEAVRSIEISGRTISQFLDDLWIGLSALTHWKWLYREVDLLSGPHEDTVKELALLRKENGIFRQEREILKPAASCFTKERSR